MSELYFMKLERNLKVGKQEIGIRNQETKIKLKIKLKENKIKRKKRMKNGLENAKSKI